MNSVIVDRLHADFGGALAELDRKHTATVKAPHGASPEAHDHLERDVAALAQRVTAALPDNLQGLFTAAVSFDFKGNRWLLELQAEAPERLN